MTNRWLNAFALTAAALSVVLIGAKNIEGQKQSLLLNVSYDPTRELYADLNARFIRKYESDTGRKHHQAIAWRFFSSGPGGN